jgi:hypothetical protein
MEGPGAPFVSNSVQTEVPGAVLGSEVDSGGALSQYAAATQCDPAAPWPKLTESSVCAASSSAVRVAQLAVRSFKVSTNVED